jgi:hypothetical protein
MVPAWSLVRTFFFFFFFVLGLELRALHLVDALHLSHALSPLCFGYFSNRILRS